MLFSEQVSSVARRDKLNALREFACEGDTIVVTKPDRLARSTAELLAIEADLSKRHVGLVILSIGGEKLDTRDPASKLMMAILTGVATWEREIMLERKREGIAKAKGEGKYKGRKPTARAKADQIMALAARGMTREAIAAQLEVGVASVYRVLSTLRP